MKTAIRPQPVVESRSALGDGVAGGVRDAAVDWNARVVTTRMTAVTEQGRRQQAKLRPEHRCRWLINRGSTYIYAPGPLWYYYASVTAKPPPAVPAADFGADGPAPRLEKGIPVTRLADSKRFGRILRQGFPADLEGATRNPRLTLIAECFYELHQAAEAVPGV